MKGSGMWLGRQQVRWLVILLALLPLLPTIMMGRLMIDKAERDRDDAVEAETSVHRNQLSHLIQRSAQSPVLAEKAAALKSNGVVKDEEIFAGALFDHLMRIFGEEVSLGIYRPDGERLKHHGEEPRSFALVREIQSGDYIGWWVAVDGVIDVPDGVDAVVEATWWRAAGVMLGVIVVAGVVWFTVHRGLRVDEIRSDLLTTVSHEMKTPLASMRVLLETLTDEEIRILKTEEEQQDYLALVLKENARLTRLADDFLTFARLERGEIKLKSEPCSLREIVSEVCEELEPAIRAVKAKIEMEIDGNHLVRGDRNALAGVVRNLIENSLKYGEGADGEAPQIVVKSQREPKGRVRLRVSDSGMGIPVEMRRLVFRRYFRADQRLAGRGSGVGLGLAICRQFVRRMKGKIGIEPSTKSGEPGCCFFVLLRAAAVGDTEVAAESRQKDPEASAEELLTPNESTA